MQRQQVRGIAARAASFHRGAVIVLACAVLHAPPALATSISWTAGDDDWFEASNWDAGVVPQRVPPAPGDDAFVNNGGTARPDSSSTNYPSGADAAANNIYIGANGSGPGAISGTVDSEAVNVDAAFTMQVGVASPGVPSATGTLDVSGADVSTGNSLIVGQIVGPGSPPVDPSTALGTVTVDGNLFAAGGVTAGSLVNGANGTAEGNVTVENGNLTGSLMVGVADNLSTGTATGNVQVLTGDLLLRGGFVFVGSTGGPATADGTVVVATGAISLADPLNGGFAPSFLIGRASGGTATGEVSAQSFDSDVNAAGSIAIGYGSEGGDATGTLNLQSGLIRTTGDVQVGYMTANAGGLATGKALLGNATVAGDDGGSFDVGLVNAGGLINNAGEGHADGEAVLNGVSGFASYRIGEISGTQHNDVLATGSLTLGNGGLDGTSTGGSVEVGVSRGVPNNLMIIGAGGTATGTLEANGGAFTRLDTFVIGSAEEVGTGIGEFTSQNTDIALTSRLSIGIANYGDQYSHVDPVAPTATGTATLTGGTLDVDSGPSPFFSQIAVGLAIKIDPNSNPSPVPVHADGTLNLTDVTLTGNAFMSVGSTVSFSSENISAIGQVNVLRGSVVLDSLVVGQGTGSDGTVVLTDTSLTTAETVGVGLGTGATGRLEATNSDLDIGGELRVGQFNAPNAAPMSGAMVLNNSTAHVASNVFIGPGYQGGAGSLELFDSGFETDGFMRIGQSSNLGALFGDGSVHLARSLAKVAGQMFLDVGATLHVDIDGLARGTEYGTFDVGTAVLDGILMVDFAFAPGPGSFFFDLIVSSLEDGISGDFDQVIVNGLSSAYAVSSGVVLDGVRGVEVYRLSLREVDVPEPGTLGLFAIGLAGVVAVARRRRRF